MTDVSHNSRAPLVSSSAESIVREHREAFRAITDDELRRVVDILPAYITAATPSGDTEFVNGAWLDFVGITPEELPDWDSRDPIRPEDRAKVVARWYALVATGQPGEHDCPTRRADGEYRRMLVRFCPQHNEKGEIIRWLVVQFDIEDVRRAQEAALEERTRIARELHDKLLQSFIGALMRLQRIFYLVESPGLKAELSGAIELASQAIGDARRAIEVLRSGPSETDDSTAALGAVNLMTDVSVNNRLTSVADGAESTGRKHGETPRPVTYDELRRVADILPACIWGATPDGENEFLNKPWLEFLGLTPGRMVGWDWQASIRPEDRAMVVARWYALVAAGQLGEIVTPTRRADGEYRRMLNRFCPQRNEKGEIIRWLGVVFDVEDRWRAEEAALEERTRLARHLNETLLQSFVGTLMYIRRILSSVESSRVKAELSDTIDLASQAVHEARHAIQGLRPGPSETNGIETALRALGARFIGHHERFKSVVFDVQVQGAPRSLRSDVHSEVLEIGAEAVRNALQHSDGRRISVEICYGDEQFSIAVRDDGKGIDPQLLSQGRRAGHFGLPGIRERAQLIGANLTTQSEPSRGTEVELRMPAERAYEASL